MRAEQTLEATEAAYASALVDELARYAAAEKAARAQGAAADVQSALEVALTARTGPKDAVRALDLEAARRDRRSVADELGALRAHFEEALRKRDARLAEAKEEIRALALGSQRELNALAARHRESLRSLRALVL